MTRHPPNCKIPRMQSNAPADFLYFRFFTESWGKSSLGARLRTRKVRGRDASLPAPLLVTSLGLVGRGTVGVLPQTPQGTLSLDPARGRRKGTKSPLDPFSRLSWSRFHAPSACSFLALRLSPLFAPQIFREEPYIPTICPITSSPALPSRSSTTAAFQPNALCSITRKSAAIASTSAVSSVCS